MDKYETNQGKIIKVSDDDLDEIAAKCDEMIPIVEETRAKIREIKFRRVDPPPEETEDDGWTICGMTTHEWIICLVNEVRLLRKIIAAIGIKPNNLWECTDCSRDGAFSVVRGMCVECAAKKIDELNEVLMAWQKAHPDG